MDFLILGRFINNTLSSFIYLDKEEVEKQPYSLNKARYSLEKARYPYSLKKAK